MRIYIDSADIEEIKKLNTILELDGVTTNPTIICKQEEKDLNKILDPIKKELKASQLLFVEVIAHDTKSIIAEAKQIVKYRKNCIPKVPVTPEGLEAIKILAKQGINVLATAILSSSQGLLAAKNGARYLAPYYNRISYYGDSYEEVSILQQTIIDGGYNCEVVGAGFKNARQVKECMSLGIDAITVTADVFKQLYMHPGTDEAVKTFEDNWKKKFKRNTLN